MVKYWLFISLFVGSLYAFESKLFLGNLDHKGKLSLSYELPLDKPFILQGFVFYKNSWRPFPVFYQEKLIWADLGPEFASLNYRIHLILP